MNNYDLNSLNEEQLNALYAIDGPVLVTAGAGSGKTRLLTHRVAYLIKELGVSPYSILAITFTNKAAGEMKERVCQMVENADGVWISTFHSMCAKILRSEIAIMPPYDRNFTIYSESDSEKVVKEAIASRNILDDKDKIKKSVLNHISNWKNGVLTFEDYFASRNFEENIDIVKQIALDYEETLKRNNALDFDDLLRKVEILFKRYPEVLEKYARRFKYILVDEFQDTNTVQYNLVRMLSSIHGNIFVVGDEDQCIYSWRGANFQNIFNFKNDYPSCRVFKLERNYRSTSHILKIANNVIKNNSERLDKKMWTDKGEGRAPELYQAYDERDEALFVAKTIEKMRVEGYDYSQMCVLMRLNALTRPFEEAFLSYNIPHRVYGGFKFFERQEVKNVISYLRIFVNGKDDISLARILNFPKRGIGDGTIAKLHTLAGDKSVLEYILSPEFVEEKALYRKLEDFIRAYNELATLNQNPLSFFVDMVVTKFGIRQAYGSKTEEDENRLLNIDSFIGSVKEFEEANPGLQLNDYLEMITLISDNDNIGQGGAVTIATVHAVKGLEFKVVFVIGLEEGIFPISRATSKSDIEEERRLMYVAITRAEEVLFMTNCSKRYMYGQSQYQSPSRFLRELGILSLQSSSKIEDSSFYPNKNPKSFDNISSKSGFNHGEFVKSMAGEKKSATKDVTIYKVGQTVLHPRYGEGTIISITPDGLVGDITFEDFGTKSLMLELAPLEIVEE